jgi:hypothetical protein
MGQAAGTLAALRCRPNAGLQRLQQCLRADGAVLN